MVESMRMHIWIAVAGVAFELMWGAALVLFPQATWLAWLLFVIGLGLLLLALYKWFATAYRIIWPGITAAPKETVLELQFYGDQRVPVETNMTNIHRWFALQNIVKSPLEGELRVISKTWAIFLVFDRPVPTRQLLVIAPSIQLPDYEVKDFGSRHAVVCFIGEIPAGNVKIQVQENGTR